VSKDFLFWLLSAVSLGVAILLYYIGEKRREKKRVMKKKEQRLERERERESSEYNVFYLGVGNVL